ncbi:MAG TPA: hypothetical protein VNF05_02065 [Acidimicrobiales bacterium]|nr:hypothetical protein [Acidimicrobiales bacterium]
MDDVAAFAPLEVDEPNGDVVAPKLAQLLNPPSLVPPSPNPDGACDRLTFVRGDGALEVPEEVDGVTKVALVATEVGAVATVGAQALLIATTPVVASAVNAPVTIQDLRPWPIRISTPISVSHV